MNARLTIVRDLLTPDLRALSRKLSDKRPLLEAMGLALVSVTQRAFNDASLRPSAWAPKKSSDGKPLLKRSGLLWRSPRIVSIESAAVTVGTDRPYAAAHQFGSKPHTIRPRSKRALFWPGAAHPVGVVHHPGLPARPFFPFDASGQMTEAGKSRVRSAAEAKLKSLLPS